MNAQQADKIKWSENIIIADGDYIDYVAFDLIVNFERMLNRKIPTANFSQWAVNIALDGKLKPGNNETQVVLLHDKEKAILENFTPSSYEADLNNKAFKDEFLGEFLVNSIVTGEENTSKEAVLSDLLQMLTTHEEVHRIMIIPNAEDTVTYNEVKKMLEKVDDDEKRITVFTMQPMVGGNFRQEILGYSLMNAMGIKAEEFK
ncbi:MAG: DUF6621 family protein [Prevotella bivia]|uniref:L-selectin n=1 Tax=Prevotella bivia DNF00320 TaxID=1401068 RepID=A0A096ADP0_9BACT|nr:DUF6621 family protein [Prevotella bivia]KGF21960.1 hypothetical protein HMPREF1651_06580 [Prevotella bivia DNF00188]KGF44671.1 hypothetical protein HMPREF0647_05935 [Prevotella bivia DNF00320]KXU59807.1 hypothetical protein HMPREF3218_0200372 [Prevotella bivia]MDU7315214.1 DUF6621 family protein [Prevotella bivia]MDZ3817023.1 DUF6621 family protein [Prevotella bivia]